MDRVSPLRIGEEEAEEEEGERVCHLRERTVWDVVSPEYAKPVGPPTHTTPLLTRAHTCRRVCVCVFVCLARLRFLPVFFC